MFVWHCLLLLFSLYISLVDSYGASIIDKDTTVTTSLGSRASLKCTILGDPSLVVWHSIDKNITISFNYTIFYSPQRIYIQRSYGRGGLRWDLMIRDIQYSDAGYYRCSIQPSGDQMVVQLSVKGVAPLPTPAVVHTDFSDCCKAAMVDINCVKYCNTNVTDNYKMMKTCGVHINKILQCVADNKNHVSCCLRRRIHKPCTPLCVNPKDVTVTSDCQEHIDKVMLCYAEGKGSIPSPPSQVYVQSHFDSLSVRWSLPTDNPALVTNYMVLYKDVNDSLAYNVSDLLEKMTYFYTIHTGTTYKTYEVKVVAMSLYGTSVPSETTIITQGVGSPNLKENITVSQCCSEQGITKECKKLCIGNGFKYLEASDLVSCASQIKIALHCLSGGRDHTPCCLSHNIPKYCTPMCGSGGNLPFDWTLSQCYIHLPQIDACRDEGMGTLPAAPRDVILKQLTDTQAVLSWQDNPASVAKTDQYTVYVNQDGALTVLSSTVITKTTVLTGLIPSSPYSAVVVASNKAGSSMPSPTLKFVTASRLPPPKEMSWSEPYNVTDCCVIKRIPDKCMKFCDYGIDYQKVLTSNLEDAITCERYLIKVLTCGSDGRDHTTCCMNSGVHGRCHHLCDVTSRTRLRTEDLVCHAQGTAILKCYKEGLDTMPRHPENITVGHKTESSIELAWDLPLRGPKPTFYIVEYSSPFKRDDTWQSATSNTTLIVLQDLSASTTYEIRVMSANDNASSIPSYTIIARTHLSTQTTMAPPVTGNTSTTHPPLPTNIKDCCVKSVSSKLCIDQCISGVLKKDGTCSQHLFATMACHSQGRNNEGCCLNAWVPVTCTPMCRGAIIPYSFETSQCVSHFDSVMACNDIGLKKPSKPDSYKVIKSDDRSITLSWTLKSGITYLVRWQLLNEDSDVIEGVPIQTAMVTTVPYTITGLKSLNRYRVEVVAKNEFGMSQPTSARVVLTESSAIELNIETYPNKKIFDLGNSVTLKCKVKSTAQLRYDFHWYRYTRDHSQSSTNSLSIEKIDPHSEGLYTCMVKAGTDQYLADYYLHVKRKPDIVGTQDDRQPIYSSATLICEFQGFPDIVQWYKDDVEVGGSGKGMITSRDSLVTTAKFYITKLLESSFGNYKCNGTNRFGSASAQVTITRLDIKAPTTTTTLSPVTDSSTGLPDDIKECCSFLKVPKQCLSSCTLKLDIKKIFSNVNTSMCLGHVNNLIRCAAAERNLTACCSKRGVPSLCHTYCHGTTPTNILSDSKMLTCLISAETIFQCLEDGRELVPTPPLGMAAVYDQSLSTIKVTWSVPSKVGAGVKLYVVKYLMDGQQAESSVNTRSFTITKVFRNKSYKIWVIAKNEHGHSHSSRTLYVNTTSVPSTPVVKLIISQEVYIEVRWDVSITSVPWEYVKIAYRDVNDEHFTVHKLIKSAIEYTIGPLKPMSKYMVYVALGNVYGEARSDVVSIATHGTRTGAQKGRGPGFKIGLGIGLTLIIVLIIVVGLVFYFLRIRRSKTQERVTFENPSYSNTTQPVKIAGLPSHQDSVRSDKQFQYDTLKEDTEYTHLDFDTSTDNTKIYDNNNASTDA